MPVAPRISTTAYAASVVGSWNGIISSASMRAR